MGVPIAAASELDTLADLIERLGGIAPNRIQLRPPPGTATEQDVLIAAESNPKRLCELIDGVLVEKAVGYSESVLAGYLLTVLSQFVRDRNLGFVTGEAGIITLFAGCVRIPDIAFVSWDRLPDRRLPRTPIPHVAPDLVVEVLSRSNTAAEMTRKREDYFKAQVEIVWEVDPLSRTVDVHTSPESVRSLGQDESLDGGMVLPEFSISLRELFSELDRQG